jgi:neutral trehalase
LSNVTKKDKQRYPLFEKLEGVSYFSREYTFYDVEEIRKNAKKARQSMEKRSLDIVLKKVVNENFQW